MTDETEDGARELSDAFLKAIDESINDSYKKEVIYEKDGVYTIKEPGLTWVLIQRDPHGDVLITPNGNRYVGVDRWSKQITDRSTHVSGILEVIENLPKVNKQLPGEVFYWYHDDYKTIDVQYITEFYKVHHSAILVLDMDNRVVTIIPVTDKF